MFEIFPPLFNSKKIEQWTANEFWKHLKLSKKERNRFNRQRMYRRDGNVVPLIRPLNSVL